MKGLLAMIASLLTLNAAAEVPILLRGVGPFSVTLVVSRGEETLCDTAVSTAEEDRRVALEACQIPLADPTPIRISGHVEAPGVRGKFEATYRPVDLAPWTQVLRDPALDFGARLEAYHSGLAAFDSLDVERFEIVPTDLAPEAVMAAAAAEAGAPLPKELAAFVSRRVQLGPHRFDGPAARPGLGGWPSLTAHELTDDWPESALPAPGTAERAFYDRVRVVFSYVGDGIAPLVWDPAAEEDAPAFAWLDEDTREIRPLLHRDGRPVSAEDALLTPFDWSTQSEDGLFPEDNWAGQAIARLGLDPLDPNTLAVDTSHGNGHLILTFEQGRTIPFFRTAEARLFFRNQSWWDRF